jgi:hypothetical protein
MWLLLLLASWKIHFTTPVRAALTLHSPRGAQSSYFRLFLSILVIVDRNRTTSSLLSGALPRC